MNVECSIAALDHAVAGIGPKLRGFRPDWYCQVDRTKFNTVDIRIDDNEDDSVTEHDRRRFCDGEDWFAWRPFTLLLRRTRTDLPGNSPFAGSEVCRNALIISH